MNDIRTRLIGCFTTVFPDISEDQIPNVTQATASAWDSIAAITLANVVEDEFNIQLDLDKLADLDSFERIYDYLSQEV
jgi:acyl carrier protein